MIKCGLMCSGNRPMTDVWLIFHRSNASFPVWKCFHLLCFCVMGQKFLIYQILTESCDLASPNMLCPVVNVGRLQKLKTSEKLSALKT